MRRIVLVLLTVLALAFPTYAATSHNSGPKKVYVKGYVRKDGTYVAPHYRAASGSGAATTSSSPASGTRNTYCTTCPRDSHGRIVRNASARVAFLRQTGYPHGRPGFVVDHIVPLECGGADSPRNMQWQTLAAAKAKDRTERSCVH